MLRRALSEDPSGEATHADLMRLYAHCGRRREAALQYELLVESLSREPGPETRRLYERIRAGSLPQESAGADRRESDYAGRHNLPSSTSFVGRRREIAEARRMLAMTRLLTLTGAGGSGKTRLAVEAAGGLAGAYPDGVWMAELAPLSESGLVPQAVAHALGISEQPGGRPLLGTLTEALQDKELLLVMDNCEHLIQASSSLAEALLSSCPRLRYSLQAGAPGCRGEAIRQVGSLSLPETRNGGLSAEDLMGCEAVRLFVERASVTAPSRSDGRQCRCGGEGVPDARRDTASHRAGSSTAGRLGGRAGRWQARRVPGSAAAAAAEAPNRSIRP